MDTAPELIEIVKKIDTAFTNGNSADIIGYLAQKPDLLFTGPYKGEWCVGFDAAASAIKALGKQYLLCDDITAYCEGNVAWASARIKIAPADMTVKPYRETFIFHKEPSGIDMTKVTWKVIQWHLSLEAQN